MKIVGFSLEQGTKYFGSIDGQRFFIGTRLTFQGNRGLMNASGRTDQRFDRTLFRGAHGFWADFIHPTAQAEGAFFHTLNTYDRARFTFSFLQFAAHVPDGDFVRYFRALLQLPLAGEYFPDLRLDAGRIVLVTDDGAVALETASSTAGLMDYLNPSSAHVEDTEIIQAARLVHWVQNDSLHRDLQVQAAVTHLRARMRDYATRYGLDGQSDRICLVVADIRHQGRASSVDIERALASADPLKALLAIGRDRYPARVATLKREIERLTDEGVLGVRSYSLVHQDFVAA